MSQRSSDLHTLLHFSIYIGDIVNLIIINWNINNWLWKISFYKFYYCYINSLIIINIEFIIINIVHNIFSYDWINIFIPHKSCKVQFELLVSIVCVMQRLSFSGCQYTLPNIRWYVVKDYTNACFSLSSIFVCVLVL